MRCETNFDRYPGREGVGKARRNERGERSNCRQEHTSDSGSGGWRGFLKAGRVLLANENQGANPLCFPFHSLLRPLFSIPTVHSFLPPPTVFPLTRVFPLHPLHSDGRAQRTIALLCKQTTCPGSRTQKNTQIKHKGDMSLPQWQSRAPFTSTLCHHPHLHHFSFSS